MTTAARRSRLVEALVGHELDGMLVTTLVNVRYLTGFTGSNGALFVPVVGSPVFLTDGRYQDQAKHELADVEHLIGRDLLGGMAQAARSRQVWRRVPHAERRLLRASRRAGSRGDVRGRRPARRALARGQG
ncbi:aminopeptidase P family N-terminal domain-containing protein [Aeromicrobium sp. UC242_57]|uniref:aminopeptidase P family N-terminal domain-containing protein n=1 Tax=Aeromicrobium sp. UC242_57 TaxID=3374624 RepID=UPI0037A28A0E